MNKVIQKVYPEKKKIIIKFNDFSLTLFFNDPCTIINIINAKYFLYIIVKKNRNKLQICRWDVKHKYANLREQV